MYQSCYQILVPLEGEISSTTGDAEFMYVSDVCGTATVRWWTQTFPLAQMDSADRQQMEGLHTLNNAFSDQEKRTLWAPSPGTGPKYPCGTE